MLSILHWPRKSYYKTFLILIHQFDLRPRFGIFSKSNYTIFKLRFGFITNFRQDTIFHIFCACILGFTEK